MNTTKDEMRAIALSILSDANPISDKIALETAVADAIAHKQGLPLNQNGFYGENWKMFNELFWDLIVERVITPGIDEGRPALPHFRVHSTATLEQARKHLGR